MKRTRWNHGATLKAQVALAAIKGDKTSPGWPSNSVCTHPGDRMKAAVAGTSRRRVWRDQRTVGYPGSQDASCQDWATGAWG